MLCCDVWCAVLSVRSVCDVLCCGVLSVRSVCDVLCCAVLCGMVCYGEYVWSDVMCCDVL